MSEGAARTAASSPGRKNEEMGGGAMARLSGVVVARGCSLVSLSNHADTSS